MEIIAFRFNSNMTTMKTWRVSCWSKW